MPIFCWKIILVTHNNHINLDLKGRGHKYLLHEKHALDGKDFV